MNRIVALILCLIGTLFAGAQHITHLGVEDGLNGRQTFNFQQDKKGFIWISNRFGVDRYDGKKVKNYPIRVLDDKHYAVRLFRVIMDRDSGLWAYNDRGFIYRYNESLDAFELYKNLSNYLRTVHFDAQNRMWIGSKSTLSLLTEEALEARPLPALNNLDINTLCNYGVDQMLVATGREVFIFNPKTNETSPIFGENSLITRRQAFIESVYYDDRRSQLWVGTVSNGVFLYDFTSQKTVWIEDQRLSNSPILTILPVDENQLFVGTDGTGAWLIDPQTLKVKQSYRHSESQDDPLSGDGVYDVFRDREGRIWISTYSDGVNILDFGGQGFQVLRHEKFNDNSLSQNQVNGILEDARGDLWFATNDGFSKKDQKTGRWHHFLKSTFILVIYEDSRGQIWVGTYSDGVYLLNRNGETLRHFKQGASQTDGPGTNFVYTIFEDANGNIWMGGKRGPISKYNPQTGLFSQITLSQANYITQKDDETLLFACESGITQMSLKNNTIQNCSFSETLRSNYICDIYVESDSIIWLATYGDGLNRCNYYTGQVQRFTRENGLNSDFVYALLPDDSGNIWFSSENGLGKLNIQNHSVTNFFVGDGLSDSRFNQMARAKTNAGLLYFGSYSGVTFFHPDKIVPRDIYTRLILQEFSLFNKVVRPGEPESPLTDALDETTQIELNYRQHSFSLNFTTVNFAPVGEGKYMWKLEGLDDKWIGPTPDHVVNYTNLAPKRYTLRLQSLGDNNKILDERELTIHISPPFWETLWARIIALVAIVVLLYWIYLYIQHLYEKRQSEDKIRFFINTTHDIRTPLTLISSPIYELKESLPADPRNSYLLDLITSNLDKLNKMFSQLLDFQKVYESREQLVVREKDVNGYLTNRIMYWKPVADKKQIGLDLLLPADPIVEWFDTDMMDKIIDNLISNALKYTPAQGHVQVRLSNDPGFWIITVTDTGIGIPKSEQKNLFTRFYRTKNAINSQESGSGLGLLLVHNYITLHGGQIEFNSEENKGTGFILRFKHGAGHFKNSVMLDKVRLPISPEDGLLDEDADFTRVRTKLLIVEDNQDLRDYLKLSLSHYYKVYSAANGMEAWNKIPTLNPDLIVSDLQMPEMDGFELCKRIKTTFETSHIPVILLTVMSDDKNLEAGLKTGADDFIPKPFDIKFLRIKIDNIINNRNILRKKFLDMEAEPDVADENAENKLNAEFIRKATQIIEAHLLDSRFSITDFAQEMGLSRSILYTKFQVITGYTPNDFIKVLRMKRAIQLFREKKYSINEVAHMTGFTEPGYFATCFRKIYGKSPKQFIEEEFG